MRAAIIAAIVSMLVSAASASAAFVVTSKNIKNGTIQLVDISSRAKAGLHGQRGPRGDPGPHGDAGPQGERGPAGFNSVTRASTLVTVDVHADVYVSATCPSGTKVVGGGFHAGSQEVTVYWSKPTSTGEGWEVKGYNNGTVFSHLMGAYALCAA